MVNYINKDLLLEDGQDKQIVIEYFGGILDNEVIHQSEMTLTESLCSNEMLTFGSCESSIFRIKINNILATLKNQWINVKIVIGHDYENAFDLGRYKVIKDIPSGNKRYRKITAYDAMYDIINTDVADWYNKTLPNPDSTMSMKAFRKAFLDYFCIDQEDIDLVNDNMLITKTIEPSELSGKDVINAICEINGCFGHIGRNGKFKYIYLPTDDRFGLYPRDTLYPADNLYPRDSGSERILRSYYISCEYEDFMTQEITKLQIRQEENDIGCIYGSGDNTYIIEDNFLVYGKSHDELTEIAQRLLPAMSHRTYRPANVKAKGNLCYEVGDAINVSTKLELVETFILSRTLTGIQALRDTYSAKGKERYDEKVNSVQKSIVQLKGKTNKIVRTVEENRLEMLDIEKGLKNEIIVTAEGLQANIDKEVKRAEGAEESLSTKIDVTAEGLQLNIDKEVERAEGVEEELNTSIVALAGQIVLKVKANGEIALVKLEADPSTGTVFQVKAKNISMTAEETISFMAGGDLNLTGKNIKISSNNFSVNKNGDVVCRNITAWGISGNAVNQFNKSVDDSEALRLARQAISNAASAAAKAQEAADKAQSAANVANTTVNNLVNTVIPDINSAIQKVADRVSALEAKHSS